MELDSSVMGRWDLFSIKGGWECWDEPLQHEEGKGLGMGVHGLRFAEAKPMEGAYSSAEMAKGGNRGDKTQEDKGKGVAKEASSSHLCAFIEVEIEAWEAQSRFLENCSEEAQREVNYVEGMVKLKSKQTSEKETWEEVRGQLHDPLYSHSEDQILQDNGTLLACQGHGGSNFGEMHDRPDQDLAYH